MNPIESDQQRASSTSSQTAAAAPSSTTTAPRPRWLVVSGLAMAGLVAFVAVIALVIFLVGWNWLRGPISTRVSKASGRTFAINGDLDLKLTWPPQIVANDVVLGNAAWSREPQMATIKRIEATVDIAQLLRGTLVVPTLTLSQPSVVFERSAFATNPVTPPNWNFFPSTAPLTLPYIGAMTIDEGRAAFRDPSNKTDLVLEVKTSTIGVEKSEYQLTILGKGGVSWHARHHRSARWRAAQSAYRAEPVSDSRQSGDRRHQGEHRWRANGSAATRR